LVAARVSAPEADGTSPAKTSVNASRAGWQRVFIIKNAGEGQYDACAGATSAKDAHPKSPPDRETIKVMLGPRGFNFVLVVVLVLVLVLVFHFSLTFSIPSARGCGGKPG
jgi:hypothetical protein